MLTGQTHVTWLLCRPMAIVQATLDVAWTLFVGLGRCGQSTPDEDWSMWSSNRRCRQSIFNVSWAMSRIRPMSVTHIRHWRVVVWRKRALLEGQAWLTLIDVKTSWPMLSIHARCRLSIVNMTWPMWPGRFRLLIVNAACPANTSVDVAYCWMSSMSLCRWVNVLTYACRPWIMVHVIG